MVDRHYSLNLKPWSATTLYVYADSAQKYSVGLQAENSFSLPCGDHDRTSIRRYYHVGVLVGVARLMVKNAGFMGFKSAVSKKSRTGSITGPFLTYMLGGKYAPPSPQLCPTPTKSLFVPQEKSVFPKFIQTRREE
jgi:hypothetical protein